MADVIQGLIMIGCSVAVIIQGTFTAKDGPLSVITKPYERGRLNFFKYVDAYLPFILTPDAFYVKMKIIIIIIIIIMINFDSSFDFDPTVRVSTVSALLGQFFISLSLYGCQQSFVQRYLSMKTQEKVVRYGTLFMSLLIKFYRYE